jgi:formylglycine-generating enzyme required for sulfatase activity
MRLWAFAAAVLGVALLGLGLLKVMSQNQQLKLGNSDAELRKQIAASDDILRQYTYQEQTLRRLIDGTADRAQKARLESSLSGLLSRKRTVQGQRDGAEAKLSEESKRKTRVNAVDGLVYVYVPPGPFTMGCSHGDNECFDNEKPPHAEQIANGFWLAETEVTQAAWKKVMNNNPSYFRSDQLPVENVDWNQAGAYCKAIGGRLPTEKEWEYAARAGTTTARYGPIDAVAWYDRNSGGTTHPVGLMQANEFGLYDMLGNVWEWTADNHDPAGQDKVVRGGSWYNITRDVRASYRTRYERSNRNDIIGFRCVGEFR